MTNNVIGVFESVSVADRVVDDLTGSGFSSSAVTRYKGDSSNLESQLSDAGVEADDAREYAEAVTRDGALVVAQADEAQTDEAVAIMNRYYTSEPEAQPGTASETQYASGSGQTTGQTTGSANTVMTDADGEQRLEVVEEELQIGKRTVERGGVRVKRVVSERQVEEQVTLRDETIHVDRQQVNRSVEGTDDLFTEQTIELTETDEEAMVAKEARVVEEVVVGKTVEDRTETVTGTVRRADVEVEELGSSYGESLASDPKHQGREWHEVEGDAKADWESKNQDKGSWEEAQGSIKNAWDRLRGKS